jgi:DNA-binding response OmpR family regulator
MGQILIVEDDRPFAEALALMLRLERHEVLIAVSADEGVRLGLAQRPDVVIADWMLKNKLDGGEVCRRIRDVCPPVKCIVVTGYLDLLPEIARRCPHLEAVITKPFHKEDIVKAVNRASSGATIHDPGHHSRV